MTKRATMIATAAITAVAVLIATGAVTNFFSPQEIGIAKERLWALRRADRVLLAVTLLGVPVLAVQAGRLALYSIKRVVGWESLPDRSAGFLLTRLGSLSLIMLVVWRLAAKFIDIAAQLAA